jgi:cytochrome b involved in lipid metabolism
MPPHSSNVMNPENIETSSFINVNSSGQTNEVDSKIEKPTIIVIHGRKYDVSNFNHPGRFNVSFIQC